MEEVNEEAKSAFRKRQTELIKIISAFVELNKSEEWNILKELVFSKSLEGIKRQMITETTSREINSTKLYRLQGEYDWASRYVDLNRYVESLKLELENIKKQLK